MKKNIVIFLLFGFLYYLLEVLFRGYSHISMFVLGGVCGLGIGLINEYTPDMPIISQMFVGAFIITVLEFVVGYIVNIKLGLNVWDYSGLKFNIKGQICLQFSFLWFMLSYLIIKLDDYFRKEMNKNE